MFDDHFLMAEKSSSGGESDAGLLLAVLPQSSEIILRGRVQMIVRQLEISLLAIQTLPLLKIVRVLVSSWSTQGVCVAMATPWI